MHKLSDVVHVNLNVSGSLLLNWILADSNGTLVITVDGSLVLRFETTLQVNPATINTELLH